tara:strand:+ start:3577 stop:4260 length:684 start_codon:yes stop_codon:yes gene_type:complete
MKKPMLSAVQKPRAFYKKAKMAAMKKTKMAKMKKSMMAMEKPKFNAKLKAASKAGKLDNNPKFKAAVDKAKMSMKKTKMAAMKKPMVSSKKMKKVAKGVTDAAMDMATGGLTAIKGLGGQRLKNYKNRKLGLGVTIKEAFADRDKKKYPNTAEGRKRFEKDARAYLKKQKPKMSMKKPKVSERGKKKFSKNEYMIKMSMKKKPKMAMKKPKASQTAGAIMKRERKMN